MNAKAAAAADTLLHSDECLLCGRKASKYSPLVKPTAAEIATLEHILS